MILSASAFNSCMIEFSISDFKEKTIKNIISRFSSFSNTERREVMFRTHWFIQFQCSLAFYRSLVSEISMSVYAIGIGGIKIRNNDISGNSVLTI